MKNGSQESTINKYRQGAGTYQVAATPGGCFSDKFIYQCKIYYCRLLQQLVSKSLRSFWLF
jgi:hypothetical protein